MQDQRSALVYLRPTRLIYMRASGHYERAIPRAWHRLITWLNDKGLYAPVGRGYGIARDNPADVGAENCRYDACVEVTPALEALAMDDVGITMLPGGPYASTRISGNYDQMRQAVAGAYAQLAPLSGLVIDAKRPVISIYIDNPNSHAEDQLRADICMPVMAVSKFERPKKAAVA